MSPDQTPAKVTPSVLPKEGQDKKLKPPPQDHHVKCPRCNSPNTKFCYYNNYNLSQPPHFCKSCRRYWTKDGALRNVPIGGGCRKNKKMKQRLAGISNSRDSFSCEIMGSSAGGGLNFFQGFLTPAMDFQLGSINPPPLTSSMFPISGTDANFTLYEHHHEKSQLNSGAVPTLTGFDYLGPCGGGEHGTLQMGTSSNNSMIVHSNLATSIESLSCINQELHWKLQQQRLAVLFSGRGDQSEKLSNQSDMAYVGEHQFVDHHQQQPPSQTHKFHLQPILFENLETRKDVDPFSTNVWRMEDSEAPGKSRLAGSATEWFFDVNPYTNGISNNNKSLTNNEDNNTMINRAVDEIDNQNHTWNTGTRAWSNMQQYDGALP